MSETASISTGIAQRYAQAVFELARDDRSLDALERDAGALEAALAESADLRRLIASPVYTRDEQGAALRALSAAMGLAPTTASTLGLMAAHRRLFVLPQLLRDIRDRIAAEKGETTAEVVSAAPLTPEQAARLSALLKARAGRDVKLKTAVDESLIGGMVVRLGSTMIDTSVRAKLAALKNAMKEVG